MKISHTILFLALNLLAAALLQSAPNACGADTNSIRLAIIPFSAPGRNIALQKTAEQLPDLLLVELSHEDRFQLVERDKVNAIWSELHLSEDGFVSAKTAGQLGHLLSCDWLVSGSVVQVGTNTQLWIKVIEVQSGMVLDLKTFPLDPTNLAAALSPIPSFLAGLNPQSPPRQFIALGRFEDRSLSSTRADWSQRLPGLIEKYFQAAGYGVVEREATAPIFSEFQFESAGLTGDYTNRVILKPAFWLIDGGYQWTYDTQEKLSVALRIQKVGGGVQIFRFDAPVADVEQTVLDTIQSALTNVSLINPESVRTAESATETDTAMKYAAGHDEFANGSIATTRNDTLNKLKEAVLLDPNNMQAKYMLGMGMFESLDAEESRQGKEILDEVAAAKDPKYATMAKNLLDDFATGRLTISAGSFGTIQITPHGQPLSWPSLSAPIPHINTAPINPVVTNLATRADSVMQIPAPMSSADFEWITAVKYYGGKVFVACQDTRPFHDSTVKLSCFDPATQSTTPIKLPPNVLHSIISIEADNNNLWLGTDGDGLVQLSRSGDRIRTFGESDGFPSGSVQSLQWDNSRLLVGFDNNQSGSIDPATGKFTGKVSDINMFKPGNDMEQAFAFPPAPGTNANYLAMMVPQACVAVCPPNGTQWNCINLSTDFDQNLSQSCMIDQDNPGLLWIGRDHGKITLLDMRQAQIVGECDIASDDAQEVRWIFEDNDRMIFIIDGYYAGQDSIYCLQKSLLSKNAPQTPSQARVAVILSAPNPGDGYWPIDFLQQNYSKFVAVQFKRGDNGEAALQRLPVQDNMFMYGSEYFFGFTFTVPPWSDGDFRWMYGVVKTEQNRYFSAGDLTGFMTATGFEDGGKFDTMVEDDLDNYPRLREMLPYSRSLQIQTIRRERLKPGKTYAIWFEVDEKDYPDFLFALTIDSPRGAAEYGRLPLSRGPAAPEPVTTANPPRSPEELRRQLETALKAKDEKTALALVYWHGAENPEGENNFPPGIFSKGDMYGEMDQFMAHNIGSVSLRPLNAALNTTNDVDGYSYGPNIPPVGNLEVASTDRQWVELVVYGEQDGAYYIPVGIKEPIPSK